jgi:hypothetical protein
MEEGKNSAGDHLKLVSAQFTTLSWPVLLINMKKCCVTKRGILNLTSLKMFCRVKSTFVNEKTRKNERMIVILEIQMFCQLNEGQTL